MQFATRDDSRTFSLEDPLYPQPYIGVARRYIMKKKKRDDIMRKLYIRLDIHEAHITGTAMNEQGTIEDFI